MTAGGSCEQAVVNVLNLYAAALDAHRWDLFDEVFLADARLSYPGGMGWPDLAAFKAHFSAYHEALQAHQHVMTNHQVLIDGERANSLTYGTFRLYEHGDGNDGSNLREGLCWYDDELVLTPVGWRIARRSARVFWSKGAAPGRAVIEGADHGFAGSTQTVFVDSLVEEAKAGRVAYFNALMRRR